MRHFQIVHGAVLNQGLWRGGYERRVDVTQYEGPGALRGHDDGVIATVGARVAAVGPLAIRRQRRVARVVVAPHVDLRLLACAVTPTL